MVSVCKQITKSLWVGKFAEYVQAQLGEFETAVEKRGDEYHSLTIFNPYIKGRDIRICFNGYEALSTSHFSMQYSSMMTMKLNNLSTT